MKYVLTIISRVTHYSLLILCKQHYLPNHSVVLIHESYDELPPTSSSLSAIQIFQEEVYNALTVLDPTKAADIP